MKKFFYMCAAILCLVVAYHFGATNAQGQAGSSTVGFSTVLYGTTTYCYVMTSNGDVFSRETQGVNRPFTGAPPNYIGNYWDGATPAQHMSMGQLKVKYR